MDLPSSCENFSPEYASRLRASSGASLARPSAKLTKGAASYRYYAGYSPEFVRSIIISRVQYGATILDPWNGAGTTTAVASELEYDSVGVDLNPAMLVVAAARLASASDWSELAASVPKSWDSSEERTEVLQRWFTPQAAAALRGFERHLLEALGVGEGVWAFDNPQILTPAQALAAFLTSAMTRKLLFSFRTSNPTWIRLRVSTNHRIAPTCSEIRSAALEFLASGPPFGFARCARSPRLVLANNEQFSLGECAYDLVMSSPPYCTRLDYVISTLPELAAIGVPAWADVERLRIAMLGGPSHNEEATPATLAGLGPSALCFLKAVQDHSSKASGAYYYRFFSRYLVRYTEAIRRIVRSVRRNGVVVLVVQDSHFKDLPVRLGDWTREALALQGMTAEEEWSYAVPNPKALNPAGKRYRPSNATVESVVVARKGVLA